MEGELREERDGVDVGGEGDSEEEAEGEEEEAGEELGEEGGEAEEVGGL